jgi:hypothetical protein
VPDTLAVASPSRTTLAELIERLERATDFDDEASIVALAPLLAGLAADPDLLADHVTRELAAWRDGFQRGNPYQAGNLILARGDGWTVRANLWLPAADDALEHAQRQRLQPYGVLHDHDFSFLTVGYEGPGYQTELYECDPEAIEGYVGEPVALRYLGRDSLPRGKIMFFRARRDVHAQQPPPALSISLNVLVERPGDTLRPRYVFDQEHRIAEISGVEHEARLLLCDLAGLLGDEETYGHLRALAAGHPTPQLRARALAAMRALAPGETAAIAELGARDRSRLVRDAAAALAEGPLAPPAPDRVADGPARG